MSIEFFTHKSLYLGIDIEWPMQARDEYLDVWYTKWEVAISLFFVTMVLHES